MKIAESDFVIFFLFSFSLFFFVADQLDREEPIDNVNFLIENNHEMRIEDEQHVDIMQNDENEWPTTKSSNEEMTSTNTTCLDADGDSNSISCHQENTTCVGSPEYCNYTYEEYRKMLDDYIFPTTGEWILIGFHGAVFLVGLVSENEFYFYFCFRKKERKNAENPSNFPFH